MALKYNTETYSILVSDLGKAKVIGEYIGGSVKTSHYCMNCNKDFLAQPRLVLLGRGCRSCFRKNCSFTQDEFNNRMDSKPDYVCLDPYENIYTKLDFKHKCGFVFNTTPERFLNRNVRCRQCFPPKLPTNRRCITTTNEFGIFPSRFEAQCAELIFQKFGKDNIERNKPYDSTTLRNCDFYIKPLELWLEVSSYGKDWYLERINKKSKLVSNFKFCNSISELKEFLSTLEQRCPTK